MYIFIHIHQYVHVEIDKPPDFFNHRLIFCSSHTHIITCLALRRLLKSVMRIFPNLKESVKFTEKVIFNV